ncbi:MAG: NADH-quinone oxidoreductase subunit N [Bacteroidia bacterium]|nr:MAG: NADH-quinone oxidoreductase subunit N [Bacteroidia bacterium]
MWALVTILISGIIALLTEIFNFKKALYGLSLLGILIALVFNVMEWNHPFSWEYSDSMVLFDKVALAFSSVLLITVFLWFLMSQSYFNEETNLVEHTSLVLFSLIGSMLLVSFNNLVSLFLGIEILSIPLYVLAASNKKDILSNEAGFKYLIMGSFASGFLLFGIALLYGASGSFDLWTIYSTLSTDHVPTFAYTGIVMILIALAFKVSIAPFHFWTPDVYEGSPIVITALMSTIVKTSVFVAIMKLFLWYFYPAFNHYVELVAGMIILSLVVSNFSALRQTNIKRLLAFSSISHASIMLLLVIANIRNNSTINALLYYTFAYSIANITAFAVIRLISQQQEERIEVLKGLIYKQPLLAITLMIALLSMAGIPVTAGFFAKYYVLSALMMSSYKWMIIAAILASILGVVYYLKLIITMFEKESKQKDVWDITISSKEWVLLVVSLVLLILAGVYPDGIAFYLIK